MMPLGPVCGGVVCLMWELNSVWGGRTACDAAVMLTENAKAAENKKDEKRVFTTILLCG
jgi:hypothetical protein